MKRSISLILLGLAISYSAVACKTEESKPQIVRPVKFANIAAAQIEDNPSFPAQIQAKDATQLSFRVGGTLSTVQVEIGTKLKTKQLVATLDQSDYKLALAQAQSGYQSAKTAADTASSAFRRVEKLFEAGSTSLSDYENAKGQLRSTKAQLSAASQQVKQARNQLQYTKLQAPFDGVVNTVQVKAGEQVGPGQSVAVVSKGGVLEAKVGVPEGIIPRIKVGTEVSISLSALGESSFPGKVREVGFVSEGSTYPIHIQFSKPPAGLRPGMTAQAQFSLGVQAAKLAIPSSALGHSKQGDFVYLLKPEGSNHKVVKHSVEVGALIRDQFEVKSGLEGGEKVATAGLSNLVDGMTVRLLGAASEPEGKTPVATPPTPSN